MPKAVPRASWSTPCLQTASAKTDRRVLAVGDSLLMGTEGPVCRPDLTHRQVCCLPGAQVKGTENSQTWPIPLIPSHY